MGGHLQGGSLLIRYTFIAVLTAGAVGCAPAGTWTGMVTDDMCRSHHEWDEHGPPQTARDCTLLCVDRGARFVLISEDQVYGIAGDAALLRQVAGSVVTVRGAIRDGVITVSAIDQASPD